MCTSGQAAAFLVTLFPIPFLAALSDVADPAGGVCSAAFHPAASTEEKEEEEGVGL